MNKRHALALSSVLWWVTQASAQIGSPPVSPSVATLVRHVDGTRASVERGRYSDELAIRLLTQGGINREGRQLRLPIPRFRMTEQDAGTSRRS